MKRKPVIVVIVSADGEWRGIRRLFPLAVYQSSPFGEWFEARERGLAAFRPVFFQGGWGKIAAAASTQYAIQRWRPDLIVNLGTCGGFAGEIERGEVILVERTVVYDIIERMADPEPYIAFYSTEIDLSWLREPAPPGARRGLLVSADRDLAPEDVEMLKARYGAQAGDWESGAIAWTAARNGTRLLILRGVSDLVSSAGGEAYGNIELFHQAAYEILSRLVDELPAWLDCACAAEG
jgi:adenosylhomocysteine nucleosidase